MLIRYQYIKKYFPIKIPFILESQLLARVKTSFSIYRALFVLIKRSLMNTIEIKLEFQL